MKFSMKQFLKQIRNNGFILNCAMPLGYVAGYPIIGHINGDICLTIPYLKYKITGKEDMTLVYPIRYTVDFVVRKTGDFEELVPVPEEKKEKIRKSILPGRFVRFEDLSCNNAFKGMNYDAPVGVFRHKAIRDLNKQEFNKLRDELFDAYDVMINAELDGEAVQPSDMLTFKQLFTRLLEPSLKMMYKMIDEPFYDKYIK